MRQTRHKPSNHQSRTSRENTAAIIQRRLQCAHRHREQQCQHENPHASPAQQRSAHNQAIPHHQRVSATKPRNTQATQKYANNPTSHAQQQGEYANGRRQRGTQQRQAAQHVHGARIVWHAQTTVILHATQHAPRHERRKRQGKPRIARTIQEKINSQPRQQGNNARHALPLTFPAGTANAHNTHPHARHKRHSERKNTHHVRHE